MFPRDSFRFNLPLIWQTCSFLTKRKYFVSWEVFLTTKVYVVSAVLLYWWLIRFKFWRMRKGKQNLLNILTSWMKGKSSWPILIFSKLSEFVISNLEEKSKTKQFAFKESLVLVKRSQRNCVLSFLSKTTIETKMRKFKRIWRNKLLALLIYSRL